MAEATQQDLFDAGDALYHLMHLARAALHTMENVELLDMVGDNKRGEAVHTVADLLKVIERDAEAAGDLLAELRIESTRGDRPATTVAP